MLDKMQWINQPKEWEIYDASKIFMFVTPKTDFWRGTHYGFIVDDGPFYYMNVGGEFELKVKVTGNYQARFDQMGLMIRKDETTWIKAGVEYIDEKIHLSAVVTHNKSDWSIMELIHSPTSIWLKAIRRLDAIEIFYSLNGIDYVMFRLAYFPDNTPLMIGITAASPDGEGFKANFEEFEVNYLPDFERTKWLKNNQI